MYIWLMVAVLLSSVDLGLHQHSLPVPLSKTKQNKKHSEKKEKNWTKLQSCSEGVDVDLISSVPGTLLIWPSASDMELQSPTIPGTCD